MNAQDFKSIFRNLAKKKFLSVTKIIGLIIGFTVFIFLAEKINFETQFDQFWGNHESIYRVGLDMSYKDGKEVRSAKNFHGASELIHAEIPGVKAHCNFGRDVITVFNGLQKVQDVDWLWSDTTFFSVFDRQIIHAESDNLLADIHGIAISQSFAKKLFGNENALNKEISLNEGWKFIIKGVFKDIPNNSHLKVDVVGSYRSLFYYMRNFDNTKQVLVDNPNYTFRETTPYNQSRWRSPTQHRPYCYLKLQEGINIREIESRVQTSLEKVSLPQNLKDADINFLFQPISDIHLKSKLEHELSVNGEMKQVYFLSLIILIVLLVCLANFINLNSITCMENMKNYTIRLLNGAGYMHLFYMMLIESVLFNFVAFFIAVPAAYLLINAQLPVGHISFTTILVLLFIVLFTVLIATIIPFSSVVKNRIFASLKGAGQKVNQNWGSRKAMVVAQFAITIILIIFTIGIYKQMQFMMNEELGFSGDQNIFSFSPMTMNNHPELANKLTTFKNEVLALSGVKSFSVSSSIPGKEIGRLNDHVCPQNTSVPYATIFNELSIDDSFLEAYNINLVAGEDLTRQNNWQSNQILINQAALIKMGFKEPVNAVGLFVAVAQGNYQIRGVIEDYHHVSLHHNVKPTIYMQNLTWDKAVGFYSFQLNSKNITNTVASIKSIWLKLYPKEEFVYNFSDAEFEAQYNRDQSFTQILTYSSLLALLISCLGLLAMAIFNTKKRIKEIGVRKVNGAKVSEILIMLNRDFIKWVAISFVVACPIAYYAMNKWLENFAYKTTLSWWVFAMAGVMALGIALLTVSWQSWLAATRNPVEALRYE